MGSIQMLVEYDTHFVYTSLYGKIAEVFANTKTKEVWFENFTKEPYRLPFGSKEKATWRDLIEFFEDRCFQRTRIDMPDILESLDLESYNPFHIVYAYDGRAFEDDRWIEFIKWEGDYDYAYRS